MMFETHAKIIADRKEAFVGTETLNYSIRFIINSLNIDQTIIKLRP